MDSSLSFTTEVVYVVRERESRVEVGWWHGVWQKGCSLKCPTATIAAAADEARYRYRNVSVHFWRRSKQVGEDEEWAVLVFVGDVLMNSGGLHESAGNRGGKP